MNVAQEEDYAILNGFVSFWWNQSIGASDFTDPTAIVYANFPKSGDFPKILEEIFIIGEIETNANRGYYTVNVDAWGQKGPAGVAELSSLGIRLFPNPASNYLNLQSDAGVSLIRIFDITGRQVHQQEIDQTDRIDLRSLKKGLYLVNVYNRTELLGYSKLFVN